MKSIIQLLRPYQWSKNLFVFLPLFFSRNLLDFNLLLSCFVAFMAFCFAASSIYCFNDISDIETDKIHPEKKSRPIASGAIPIHIAYLIMIVLLLLSLGIAYMYGGDNRFGVIYIISFYYIINIAYSLKLKNIVIIDVFILSLGFVLRVIAGGVATGVHISNWIILMTFLLSLFLAFAKRRDDVVIFEQSGVITRKNINNYNLSFLNQVISIVAAIIMVCYIMYTVSPEVISRIGSRYLYSTSIFVLAGIIRYLQITIVDVKSGNPTRILIKDRFIQVCVVCWLVVFGVIIYL